MDGKSFGDGKSINAGAAAGKPKDFTQVTTSNPGGAHDFVRDPKGTVTGSAPSDYTKAQGVAKGTPPAPCPKSIPAGGKSPLTTAPSATSKTPFKNMAEGKNAQTKTDPDKVTKR